MKPAIRRGHLGPVIGEEVVLQKAFHFHLGVWLIFYVLVKPTQCCSAEVAAGGPQQQCYCPALVVISEFIARAMIDCLEFMCFLLFIETLSK